MYDLEEKQEKFAAMYGVPFKSRVRVCNQGNRKCVDVQILDRGPARRLNRLIDLSKSAFESIAEISEGLISVTVTVL